MTKYRERRCRECGSGKIRLRKAPDRKWKYKRFELDVPSDFEIPTCDSCGEEWLDPERAKALGTILKQQYAHRLTDLFIRAVEVLAQHRSQRALEQLFGVSQGYFSKVIHGTKMPSEQIVSQLVVAAKAPKARLNDVEQTWGSVPPPWLCNALDSENEGRDKEH